MRIEVTEETPIVQSSLFLSHEFQYLQCSRSGVCQFTDTFKLQAIILFWILTNDLVKFKDHFSNKGENNIKSKETGHYFKKEILRILKLSTLNLESFEF